MILHSYSLGLQGRVSLYALPGSVDFYKSYDFLETGEKKDRMILYEVRADDALRRLNREGLI